MKEVTGGYVTQDGRYHADRKEAEQYEFIGELKTAASCKMGYSIHKLLAHLEENFDLIRKTK